MLASKSEASSGERQPRQGRLEHAAATAQGGRHLAPYDRLDGVDADRGVLLMLDPRLAHGISS